MRRVQCRFTLRFPRRRHCSSGRCAEISDAVQPDSRQRAVGQLGTGDRYGAAPTRVDVGTVVVSAALGRQFTLLINARARWRSCRRGPRNGQDSNADSLIVRRVEALAEVAASPSPPVLFTRWQRATQALSIGGAATRKRWRRIGGLAIPTPLPSRSRRRQNRTSRCASRATTATFVEEQTTSRERRRFSRSRAGSNRARRSRSGPGAASASVRSTTPLPRSSILIHTGPMTRYCPVDATTDPELEPGAEIYDSLSGPAVQPRDYGSPQPVCGRDERRGAGRQTEYRVPTRRGKAPGLAPRPV